MTLQAESTLSDHWDHPLAIEFFLITGLLIGLYLWQQLVRTVLPAAMGLLPVDGLVVNGLLAGVLHVGALVVFAAVYTSYRRIPVRRILPASGDWKLVGVAALLPVGLVGLTKLVGDLTGVPYNSLTMTAVAANPPVRPILLLTGLAIFIGVPVLVILCQVLIQRSFNQAVGPDAAIALTTFVTGFVLLGNTGGLSPFPDLGKVVGIVLVTVLLGVAVFAADRFESDRTRMLAGLPLLLVFALIVFSVIAEIGSIAGGLFVVTHLIVLAIAAYTYDRTDSLAVPALAYTSLMLANRFVVVVFEAGMQSW